MHAAVNGHGDAVDELVLRGADLDTADGEGRTVSMYLSMYL